MPHTQFTVDGSKTNPARARFIYQRPSWPGGHEYELELNIDDVDRETLEYADFRSDDHPSEAMQKGWMFWLGHIVSRLHDPNECEEESWVVNDIHRVSSHDRLLIFRGECSKWVNLSEDRK